MSISAMKQALQVLYSFSPHASGGIWIQEPELDVDEAAAALRQAIEQAEKQEPVAWMTHTNAMMPLFHMTRKSALNWETQPTPLYAAPVHASDISQERVDETAKDRHEWIGLTDEEIDKFMPYCHTDQDLSDFRTFAFEIEAKLKEKNV